MSARAQHLSKQLRTIQEEKTTWLSSNWPAVLPAILPETAGSATTKPMPSSSILQPASEEKRELAQLLAALAALPAHAINKSERVFFETKITDWLGFSVTCQPQGAPDIPFHTGKVRALQYPSYPNVPASIPEAGISRSKFDWMSTEMTHHLDHTLFVHPSFLYDQTDGITAKPWFVGKKAVVIDPLTMDVSICLIADILPEQTTRYQFGAMAGLMRNHQWWKVGSAGVIFVLYTAEQLVPGSRFITQ